MDEACDLRTVDRKVDVSDDRMDTLPTGDNAGDDRRMSSDGKVDGKTVCEESLEGNAADRGGSTNSVIVPQDEDDKMIECDVCMDEDYHSVDRGAIRIDGEPVCVGANIEYVGSFENNRECNDRLDDFVEGSVEADDDTTAGDEAIDEASDLRTLDRMTDESDDRMVTLATGDNAGDDRRMSSDGKVDGKIVCEESLVSNAADRGGSTNSVIVPQDEDDKMIKCDNCMDEFYHSVDRGAIRSDSEPVCVGANIEYVGSSENNRECNDRLDDFVEGSVQANDDTTAGEYNRSAEEADEDRIFCHNTGVDRLDVCVNDRRFSLDHRNMLPASESEAICLENPLLTDIANRKCYLDLMNWSDPLVADMADRSMVAADLQAPVPLPELSDLSGCRGSKLRRSRGRKKKFNDSFAYDADVDKTICVDRSQNVLDSRAGHRMSVLGSNNNHLATDGEPSSFEFPLLANIASRADEQARRDWLDPIVANETSGLLSTMAQQLQKKLPHVPDMDATCTGGRLRRPRGRPKKSNPTSVCTPTSPLNSKASN